MHATEQGTAEFIARRSCGPGHARSALGLTLSSLGMGSYLGKDDDAVDALYAEAVRASLAAGINVIDTSINYRHQRSERALGAGLRAAFAAGEARREEVLFCTKAGYLPFDRSLPPDPHGWLFRTWVESGIAQPREIVSGCHCLAPRYLEDQVARSLANTGLAAIDVLYLHNPEQQMDQVSPGEFLDRWRAACVLLERMADLGRIRFYGAATWNGLRIPRGAPGHLHLESLVRAAREAGGDRHRFRVLQLPYNLAMLEACWEPTQSVAGRSIPLTQAAAELGLIVFSSVPLLQGKLTRGAPDDLRKIYPGLATDAQRALQFVRNSPGIVAPLVGMKSVAHVAENAAVFHEPLAPAAEFEKLFSRYE